MFKISRRQTILRASLLGCLVVAVLSTAAYFIINQQKDTNAITQTGVKVDVFRKSGTGDLEYGTHMTHYYRVRTPSEEVSSTNKVYDGYCAEPASSDPTGEEKKAHMLSAPYAADSGADFVNRIKLLIFLREHKDDTTVATEYNSIFNGIGNDSYWGTDSVERIYAYTHAVIGTLYSYHKRQSDPDVAIDTSGLNDEWKTRISEVRRILRDHIAANSVAWQKATTFALLRTGGEKKQDVVWIEPTGSIIVRKCDSEIYNLSGQATCTSQSSTSSLAGITFTLKNGNTTIATQTLSGTTNQVVFRGLDLGVTYTVVEGNSNNTVYNVTATSQSATLPNSTSNSQTATLTFTNTIKKGNLTVKKQDKDTGSCPNITNGLSLAGIVFNLYLKDTPTANSIVYDNAIKTKGSLVAQRTLTDSNPCSVKFENLPYGEYELQEIIPESIKGWVKDESKRTITIPTNNNPEVETLIENQPIRGNLRFIKNDPANHITMANAVFEISSISNDYMENHIVISDENGVVDTNANLHSFNTNGYDAPYHANEGNFIPYSGYGTWFGVDKNHQPIPVRDDVGALPYGTYLIQELKCDAFLFCDHTNNQKRMFSITEHGVTVSFEDTDGDGEGDWNNDCAEFTLATTATDNKDGDHYIEAGQDTAIKDVVNYCAKAGFTFTIKGILMDKSTNQPLLINGETLEQSVEISPTDNDCGTVEMLFPLNSSDLAGKSVVVFEKLYYKNELKSSHEDINDPGQTVDIVSLGTIAVDNSDDDKLIVPGEGIIIKDTVSYCAKKGSTYTLEGRLIDKATGEPLHLSSNSIYPDEGGRPFVQITNFTAEDSCGTVELLFGIDSAVFESELKGHQIVVYETLYEEIPGQPDRLEKVISHEDPNDPDQTVYVIDISTTVQPTEDGTKVFPLDSDVTVTDMVHYCLQPGLEYTVKGIVMDKSTGNGLLVDSKLVEQSVTFTPTEVCGEFPMYYTFNTKGLAGAQLVIFESLYYNDELLIEHKDIENELESFEIDITPPETGFITKNASGSQETSHQELLIIAVIAIAPVGIYAMNRRQARKHFLNR